MNQLSKLEMPQHGIFYLDGGKDLENRNPSITIKKLLKWVAISVRKVFSILFRILRFILVKIKNNLDEGAAIHNRAHSLSDDRYRHNIYHIRGFF